MNQIKIFELILLLMLNLLECFILLSHIQINKSELQDLYYKYFYIV
jgi:hypothetical protein